jgi:8-oxo-dGTP pyrophosphatase MutT (NUDIX family)
MSFGVICFKSNGDYLMIQRKDSLCFMEFIRGKYDIFNVDYIRTLFSNMTADEREHIMKCTFEELWNRVWFQPFVPRHSHDFIDAKRKFDTLMAGFHIVGSKISMAARGNEERNDVRNDDHNEAGCTSQYVKLSVIVDETVAKYTEPEWGFPKGRRRLRELDVDCAVREFCEETGFIKSDINLFNYGPVEEVFAGTNHVLYRHVYYIASLKTNSDLENRDIVIDPSNVHQAREVRQVKWFNFDDALGLIREHNRERRQLFKFVDTVIKSIFLPEVRSVESLTDQQRSDVWRLSGLSPFAPTFYPQCKVCNVAQQN